MAEALGQGRCLATAKDSDSMGLGNAARIMPREDAIDPDLPIIDPHHHLWQDHPESHYAAKAVHPFNDIFAQDPVYLRDEFLADLRTGHNILATVYVECGAFYHEHGSENDRALGEIERVVEIAQVCAGDPWGGQPCAAIVGYVDLTSDDAPAALARAKAAGAGKLRGIRNIGPHDDERVLGPVAPAPRGLYGSDAFRRGFAALAEADLSFDAWVFAPQIGEVTDLARAFPHVPIMLDHVGTPLGIARHRGTLAATFPDWQRAIRELATCPNVHVKLGGLGMPFTMLDGLGPTQRVGSETLARLWQPYIESCIEAFGPDRALFESNFPVDRWGADYVETWNAFKRLTRSASADEKSWLFARSAAKFYRLDVPIA